ncbi:sugar ABC transporter ATP-binding protein [Sorangium sp. So ce1151]|uniref:sugar ABC transporter ATP-binding protein n=1 Tax=Sorangium sp. So ce1151 TaxID=3133332 RepID=UPI003F5F7FD7
MAGSKALLSVEGLSKSFPGVRALHDVHLEAHAGEIQAMMGENGAGKSTLIKLLTGVYLPDAGALRLDGALIRPTSPRGAEALGISTVHQEISLIPHLSIADNIMLGRQPRRFGLIDQRAVRAKARQALARLALDLDVTRSVAALPTALQQMVAIARALAIDARILILDEPTSSLDEAEAQRLFDVMRRLKAQGLAILFVTHFLDQVYAVSDRITVLRNGCLVGQYASSALPRLELVQAMLGVKLGAPDRPAPGSRAGLGVEASTAEPVLAARGLERKGVIGPIDLALRAGEVVGLAGLLGSGRSEAARMLFGIEPADRGELRVDGRELELKTPRHAIRAGLSYCPEDRKVDGIVPNLSVRENLILALQASQGALRVIPRHEQERLVQHYIKALSIKTPSPETPIKLLSGGNQQKVLLARWMAMQPRVMLLDEPTRGVDIGAKLEIEGLVKSLSEKGVATVLISSELEEIARNCSRVVVLRDRKQQSELAGESVTAESIIQAIAQQKEAPPDARENL